MYVMNRWADEFNERLYFSESSPLETRSFSLFFGWKSLLFHFLLSSRSSEIRLCFGPLKKMKLKVGIIWALKVHRPWMYTKQFDTFTLIGLHVFCCSRFQKKEKTSLQVVGFAFVLIEKFPLLHYKLLWLYANEKKKLSVFWNTDFQWQYTKMNIYRRIH